MTYDPTTTTLLLVDLHNDFLSEGGKLWPRVKAIAEEVRVLDHLRVLVRVVRDKGYKVCFVPHHCWEPGDYVKWRHLTPYQLGDAERQTFAKGTWGGAFHGDFQAQPGDVVHEHWGSSRFANADLDLQLKQFGKPRDPGRHDRQHLYRGDRPIRCRARLPRHLRRTRPPPSVRRPSTPRTRSMGRPTPTPSPAPMNVSPSSRDDGRTKEHEGARRGRDPPCRWQRPESGRLRR